MPTIMEPNYKALSVKVRDYEGKLIMILLQTTEHIGDIEIELYKVIIEIKKYETITLERVRINDILICAR